MKNLKYIACLLFICIVGIGFKASGQNVITQTPPLSTATFSAGSIVTIQYQMDFTKLTGNYQQLKIVFDPLSLQFQTTNLPGASNGMFNYFSNIPAGTMIYQTSVFSAPDNNFVYSTSFTISFMVIKSICLQQVASNVQVSLSTFPTPLFVESDIQSVNTTVNILNPNSNIPTVSIDLLEGQECSSAMYKITSFGYEDATHTGVLTLKLPDCATVQGVYNTSGNPVVPLAPPVPAGAGFHKYTWNRSGVAGENLQLHYVMVKYSSCSICATQLDVNFNSFSICDQSAQTAAPVIRPLNFCACTDPPPTQLPCGFLVLSKWLVKTPFRYLPSPDNCKTHDYYIKIDNVSCDELQNVNLDDFISSNATGLNAVLVTGVSLSLTPILSNATNNFSFTVSPQSSLPLINTVVMGGPPVTGNYGIWPGNNTWSPGTNLVIGGSTNLPAYSSLLIKITHVLDVASPPLTIYNNTATLGFDISGNHYATSVDYNSRQDNYEPVIIIDKKVRNLLPVAGSFTSNVTANPGETVQFAIKIRNYGMSDVNATLNDAITQAVNNFENIDITSVTVTETSTGGMVYNPAIAPNELTDLRTAIITAINSSGSSLIAIPINPVRAGVCNGFSELTITFNVKIKPCNQVVCSSVYTNSAEIGWTWDGVHKLDGPKVATVNIDLFKNLEAKLEASCNGPNGPWFTGNIYAVPGTTIWYKASFINNSSCAIPGVKMMILLPNNPGPYTSTQNSLTGFLNAFSPSSPAGTGLFPANTPIYSPSSPNGTMSATSLSTNNNWLSTPPPTPSGPLAPLASTKFIYKYIPMLNAGATTEIAYQVTVPINAIGQQYNTAFGYSIGSVSTPVSCPIVKRLNLKLTIATQDNCGHSKSGCDLLAFDSKITQTGPLTYQVSLSNIFDLNGAAVPNINNMDIVVHQPYSLCAPTPGSGYTRRMWPFTISPTATATSSPIGLLINGIAAPGQRFYTITATPAPLTGFGNIDFNISLVPGSPGCNLPKIFPINIIFRDNNGCTLCERMIYLKSL